MKDATLLSIITVNLNNKDGLIKTIESIKSQNNRNFEYIVIDGCSTDGSKEVLSKNSQLINVLVSEPDRGIYDAMNKGVKMAHGKYCYFLNSGDTLYNDKIIDTILPLLQHDYHTLGFELLFENPQTSSMNLRRSPDKLSLPFFVLYALNHQGVITQRKFLLENPFDISLRIVSDWKFYLQEFLAGRLTYKNYKVTIAVYDSTGLSSTAINTLKEERNTVMQQLRIDFLDVFNNVPPYFLYVLQTHPPTNFVSKLFHKIVSAIIRIEKTVT